MHLKYKVPVEKLTTHIIEDRRAEVSPWGLGNSKLGANVYTYSKLPGKVYSCPGSSAECEAICYAKKLIKNKWVWQLWTDNTERGDELPPLPEDGRLVRFHVSGDFDTVSYVNNWSKLAESRPEVIFWGYTRSWRVPELLPALEFLKKIKNVTLFASMDKSMKDLPPQGWRRAWIEGDDRLTKFGKKSYVTFDGVKAIICPEEAGLIASCEKCTYCFNNLNGDLVFLEH